MIPRVLDRGFTLIELIVVIAIIVILVLFIIPVINALLGGKSLRMARNTFDGYLSGLRLEAVNRGAPVLVCFLPPLPGRIEDDTRRSDDRGKPWKLAVGEDGATEEFEGEGMVAFLIDPVAPANAKIQTRFQYMNRNLMFASKFDRRIRVHPAKRSDWRGQRLDRTLVPDLDRFANTVGLPAGTFYVYIREDGMAQIPGDVPGFKVDGATVSNIDGDIVLEDGTAVAFLDISMLLKVRGRVYPYPEFDRLGGAPRYRKPESATPGS